MNVYYVLAFICLLANALLMYVASNKDQNEAEANLLQNLASMDSTRKEEYFRKLDLSEFQIKKYLTDLDSNSRTAILKGVQESVGLSADELKLYYEKLDEKSRHQLFEQIKPEFEQVKGEIKESETRLSNRIKERSDWKLEGVFKDDLDSILGKNGWLKEVEISIAYIAGNEGSSKMARYLVTYLHEKGYNARITGTQFIHTSDNIRFDLDRSRPFLWVGQKPSDD